MSDRKDSYFLQLVDEAFFDACFDDLENADRALAVDIGFIGISSGIVATQHSPTPDLTIDLTAGVSYDQAGRRCEITSAVGGLDCSVDENSTSTAVATPGNERWLSVQVRFDRTLTGATVDGNGNTVYTDQDESYSLNVVMAGEYALGTNTKPALPTDGRLVCDIHLINGQTQILNANIYTDRRQDFSIYSAAEIPVTSGSWTFLSPATDDVQATFDFIDARTIARNASKEVTEDLIPASALDLGSAGNEWNLFVDAITAAATSTWDGNLIPATDGNNLGENAGPYRWSLYSDLIELYGDLKTDAAVRVDGNLIPKTGGNDLGSATLRWDLFANTVTIYSQLVLNTETSTGVVINLSDMESVADNWTLASAYYNTSKVEVDLLCPLDIPNGVTITGFEASWYQASNQTSDLYAQLQYRAHGSSSWTQIGTDVPCDTFGSQTEDSLTGQSHTVDRTTNQYRIVFTSSTGTVENRVYSVKVNYDILNLLAAIMVN